MSDSTRFYATVALTVFAYFVAYPDDLQAIIQPLNIVLSLTNAISPWFYGLAAVGIVTFALRKACDRRAKT